MSYLDGKNVPGSNSPYTVWLRSVNPRCVVGIDYRNLNDLISLYNHRLYKYVDFWNWLSEEAYFGEYTVTGFDYLWNQHNPNMSRVIVVNHS